MSQHEIPTTGANLKALKILAQMGEYVEAHRRNRGGPPPAITVSEWQANILSRHLRQHDLNLEECCFQGLRIRVPR
jgi:hypothetical protein